MRARSGRGLGWPVWTSAVALWASVSLAAPPTITSQPSRSVPLNEPYRYDAVDGRAEASGTPPFDWSLPVAPAGMEIDNLTGELFWFAGQAGTFDVELMVTNAEGEARQPFSIEVTSPAPPLLAPLSVTQVGRGQQVSLRLSATGAQPIVFSLLGAPAEARLDPVAGQLSWVPRTVGTESFLFLAANAVGEHQRPWTVEVVDVSLPLPTAAFSAAPSSGEVPLLATFDASASRSNHPTDPLLSHQWDFGDGSPSRVGVLPSIVHGYLQPGSYRARLTVENLYLQSASADGVVRVTQGGGLPPEARIAVDVERGPAPLLVNFRCECAEGDTPIVAYEWDYGDGEGSTRRDPSHVFARPGGYNVKLKVIDSRGLAGQDSLYIPVGLGEKLPPFARARAQPVAGDAPLTVQLVSEFGDPDGVVVSRQWSLPDGRRAEGLDPTWLFERVGTYTARLEVQDNDGLSSVDTVEVLVTRNGLLPPRIISAYTPYAEVGRPYLYDEDGRPTARGGLPQRWSLGKLVGEKRVNAPEGAEVDESTGRISWTPRKDQAGEVTLSLTVENAAGVDVQDLVLRVSDRSGLLRVGCGGAQAPAGAATAVLGLLVGWWLSAPRLRRRRRGG